MLQSLIDAKGVGSIHAAADFPAHDESDDGTGGNIRQPAPALADLRAGRSAPRAAQQLADHLSVAASCAEVDRWCGQAVGTVFMATVTKSRRAVRRETRVTGIGGWLGV